MESARGSGKKATVQADLFSIHGLVAERGGNGAVAYAQSAAMSRGPEDPPSLLDALAGRSGRRIVDTASASMTREIEGGSEIGYSYSAWCLAGLPHRDRPTGEDWLIKTDFAQLLVRPGA